MKLNFTDCDILVGEASSTIAGPFPRPRSPVRPHFVCLFDRRPVVLYRTKQCCLFATVNSRIECCSQLEIDSIQMDPFDALPARSPLSCVVDFNRTCGVSSALVH